MKKFLFIFNWKLLNTFISTYFALFGKRSHFCLIGNILVSFVCHKKFTDEHTQEGSSTGILIHYNEVLLLFEKTEIQEMNKI